MARASLILPAEVLARVGLALVESATPADIADLPPRLRDQLVEWARVTCNYYSKRDKE